MVDVKEMLHSRAQDELIAAIVNGVGAVVRPVEVVPSRDVPETLRPALADAGSWVVRLSFDEEIASSTQADVVCAVWWSVLIEHSDDGTPFRAAVLPTAREERCGPSRACGMQETELGGRVLLRPDDCHAHRIDIAALGDLGEVDADALTSRIGALVDGGYGLTVVPWRAGVRQLIARREDGFALADLQRVVAAAAPGFTWRRESDWLGHPSMWTADTVRIEAEFSDWGALAVKLRIADLPGGARRAAGYATDVAALLAWRFARRAQVVVLDWASDAPLGRSAPVFP